MTARALTDLAERIEWWFCEADRCAAVGADRLAAWCHSQAICLHDLYQRAAT